MLLCALCHLRSAAQHKGRGDFYDSARSYDFSKIWHSDSVLNLEYVDNTLCASPKYFNFPAPLGFIGDTYQRFYIHFSTVRKSKLNPYQYMVIGKTKVKNHICPFKGTITIDTACLVRDTAIPASWRMRQGYLICSCDFKEDSNCKFGGIISGMLKSDWCLYKGQIRYNNLMGVSDGYSNNEFEGEWKGYAPKISKKCNWGDFRIPDCGDLDIGTGEFSPDGKYEKNGWQSYTQQWLQNEEGKKANAAESAKWWK